MSAPSAINDGADDDGIDLISKKRLLFEAVAENDVSTLKELLNSRKWYTIRDKNGRNLLHHAVLKERKSVFNYLLSLDDFPLEEVDNEGHTALQLVFLLLESLDIDSHYDDYIIKLLKVGANVDVKFANGDSLLHLAVAHRSPKVTGMLLYYGADATMCDASDCTVFDQILNGIDLLTEIRTSDDMLDILEHVFYFTFDEWSSHKVLVGGLLKLARYKSPLFHQVAKFCSGLILDDDLDDYCLLLFTIDPEYLRILLENYSDALKACLQSYSSFSSDWVMSCDEFHLENFEMLMQSSLREDTIELISELNACKILYSQKGVDEILALMYYLLSYGMVLTYTAFQQIYKITDYSEDFKNFLFLDVQEQDDEGKILAYIVPFLIYYVKLDMDEIIKAIRCLKVGGGAQIFSYFAHPKFRYALWWIKPENVIGRPLPRVPLLQELARNAFRKFFVKKFEITTAKQFYTLIRQLPISYVHEKIITYETKLY